MPANAVQRGRADTAQRRSPDVIHGDAPAEGGLSARYRRAATQATDGAVPAASQRNPASRRSAEPSWRDIAFAIIGILALIAVLVAATIVPTARAARLARGGTHLTTSVKRLRSCPLFSSRTLATARARHESGRLQARRA